MTGKGSKKLEVAWGLALPQKSVVKSNETFFVYRIVNK
jgi:hypothetical protein